MRWLKQVSSKEVGKLASTNNNRICEKLKGYQFRKQYIYFIIHLARKCNLGLFQKFKLHSVKDTINI